MSAPDTERTRRHWILGTVTAAHAVSHFVSQGFLVALPEIRAALGIGPVAVGAIMAVREVVGGVVSLPAGVLCDRLRRHWGLVLAVSMIGFGVGWWIVAASPTLGILIAGMALLSLCGSVSHLPSMAALSNCFPARRGTALSIHGVGGTLGDVVGPSVTGLLLGWLTWRGVLSWYAAAPVLLAGMLYWAFRGLRNGGDGEPAIDLRGQLREARKLLTDGNLWLINLVAAMRGMCFQAYTTFLPLFLTDEVGFGPKGRGLHIGLMFGAAMVASPAMGYLSDRLGRKTVVVPTLLGLSALSVLLALYGEGIMLTVLIGSMGLFMRSDYGLLSAMVLDAVGDNVATTTLGIVSFTRFTLSAVSPLIAGALYDSTGMDGVFFYAAGLYALGAVLLSLVRLPAAASGQTADEESST